MRDPGVVDEHGQRLGGTDLGDGVDADVGGQVGGDSFEYEPIRTTVTIRPGQAELELTLTRLTDLAATGWYSGDTHVHFVSTLGAELEARGEDVRVTNLLLSQWGHLFTNTEEFTGHPHTSADGHTHVFAGQKNRSGMLGHINLLGPPPCHGFGLRDRCEIILREGLADRVGASERVPSGRELVDQHIHVGRHPPHGLARDVLGIFPEAR